MGVLAAKPFDGVSNPWRCVGEDLSPAPGKLSVSSKESPERKKPHKQLTTLAGWDNEPSDTGNWPVKRFL